MVETTVSLTSARVAVDELEPLVRSDAALYREFAEQMNARSARAMYFGEEPRPHARDALLHVAEGEFRRFLDRRQPDRAPRLAQIDWTVKHALRLSPIGSELAQSISLHDPADAVDILFRVRFEFGSIYEDLNWWQRPRDGEAIELATWLRQNGAGAMLTLYDELARRYDRAVMERHMYAPARGCGCEGCARRFRIDYGGGYRAGRNAARRAWVPFDGPQRDFFAFPYAEIFWRQVAGGEVFAAVERGEKLLRDWLSPEQLAQYERDRRFEVIGCHSKRRYRIRQSSSYNVELLRADGTVEEDICFVPQGELVMGDVMLAQKIALETDEKGALAVANRKYRGPERRIDPIFADQAAFNRHVVTDWIGS